MSDQKRPREHGENPTQERMDEEGYEGRPVDVEWDDDDTEPTPHEGEAGQTGDVA